MKTAGRKRFALLAAAVLVALTVLWAMVWRAPLGRDNWFLEPARRTIWPLSSWIFPIAVLLVCGAFAWVCAFDRFRRAKNEREQRTSTRMTLGALVVLATLWPWSLLGPLGGFQLVAALWSDVSNQYFSTAYRIEDARQFSREYSNYQRNTEITKSHVATHPPGAVLFFYGARRVYENVPLVGGFFNSFAPAFTGANTPSVGVEARRILRDATSENVVLPDEAIGGALWCAFLLSLCVGLTVPAVFHLARGDLSNQTDGDRRGLLAAALFALAPTSMLFAFSLDALLAFLVAWSLVLWAQRQRTGNATAALFCGAILGLAVYVSFGALSVWGLIVVALALCWGARSLITTPILVTSDLIARRKPVVHRPFSDFALILAGFGALWLMLLLFLPMPIGAIYARAMEVHHMATLTSRSHAGWALLNVFVFALFCGWPLTLGVGAQLQRVLDERRRAILTINAVRALGIAAVVLCVGLSLAGTVRGETERLWLFLLAPLCALAAIEYSMLSKVLIGALLGLTALQTLILAGTLAPLIRPY